MQINESISILRSRIDSISHQRHQDSVSMTFRVVRTNRYSQDLGLIHSTNGNHLESPNEGSSIDHQVTIHLHAQNITIFPTNETWCFDRSRAPIFLILPLHQHRIDVSAITNEEEGRLVEKEKEKEKEIEPVADDGMSLEKIIDSEDTDPLSKVLEMTTKSSTSDEESLSIDDLLAQIPEDMMLPYTTFAEPTRIKFGLGIEIKEIKEIKEGDWYKASLPQIDIADKGKAPLVEPDEIKGHPAQELFSSLFIYSSEFSSWGFQVVIQQMVCFQWLIRIQRDSADTSLKSIQQMLLSRPASTGLSLQRVFAKKCKRQRFDKLERRRGVHCFVSADEVISRRFLEEFSSWLSIFVEDCETTTFG
ncbi:Exocyst complex subunit Sec15-like family protein [Dorcoceras hygrometricum]|uniref:Exocyst complex subunit Sec15-like family protein n=1 Tax=Dorcoceras hygrometricum TaxID=472368 RepID=A0A2Z7ACP0_9LAMI|nr:Exocyst complex subunit Sec15-like family protein [Dorcoceras hygrometricum]